MLVDAFHVVELETAVKKFRFGAVETREQEESSLWISTKPIAFFALLGLGTKIYSRGAVSVLLHILHSRVNATLLDIPNIGCRFKIVRRDGPEILHRYVWRHHELVVLATIKPLIVRRFRNIDIECRCAVGLDACDDRIEERTSGVVIVIGRKLVSPILYFFILFFSLNSFNFI